MMSKKGRTDRKVETGGPLAANKSVLPPDPAVKTPAKRESVVIAEEQPVLGREDGADQRKQASDLRQSTAKQRQEAAELRENTAIQRQGTADQREEIADVRQNTADQRDGIANLREDVANLRQDTANLRDDAADLRQSTADLRQEAADLRQDTADLRQVNADLRQVAEDQREETASVKATLDMRNKAELHEVNERLITTTIHAQTMTGAAELATEQMTHMAEHDFLTGLPNRALLTDRLAQAIALAQRHGKKVALLYLDLDHFKHVNDSLGHTAGDHLLQSTAKRLQTCVRLSDTVSRQGGDEFVVLLSEVEDVHDAALTAKKLIKVMTKPHLINGHKLHVSLSIGISLYPDDGNDVETVVRNADTAMYHAKKKGRNNYQVFTAEMNVRADP